MVLEGVSMMFGELFAVARRYEYARGPHRCFFCGTPCDERFRSERFVKESFTSRDTVCGGDFVCGGCVAALDEQAEIRLPDGTIRTGQKTRCYSWVASGAGAVAATKAHRQYLLSACLHPPAPPFIICLSDSGQKHLLYRSAVCFSRTVVTVTLEAQRISFHIDELAARYRLVVAMAAAVGKPALESPLTFRQQMTAIEMHETEAYLSQWQRVRSEPLSQLALWFCPGKKECLLEYNERLASVGKSDDGAVSAEARGFR
jgi:CRISPR type IV-associated protein Csf1